MRIGKFVVFGLSLVATAANAQDFGQRTSESSVRRARGWTDMASEGWCAIKVWVDDEAEFSLDGERLSIFTTRGAPVRDVASECSTPLPRNVENFRFRGIDGRGDVRLLEEPSARNRGRAIVRIRDTKAGGEEYHYRLEWGRGSAFTSGRSAGAGAGNRGGGFGQTPRSDLGDFSRMRTRDLRLEIDRMANDISRRRLSADEIDDYIDRVRFDRWTSNDVARDLERRR